MSLLLQKKNYNMKEAVECIFGNEFFKIINEKTNRYHLQNLHKYV